MAKKIIISSGNGGAGKSTFAINLASEICDKSVKTLILDMNYGKRDIDLLLGYQDKIIYDLGDVAKGIVDVSEAIIKVNNNGLYYLPSPLRINKLISNLKSVKHILEELSKFFSLIVVDISYESILNIGKLFEGADYGFLILTNDIINLRNSELLLDLYKKLGISQTFSVINKYRKYDKRSFKNILELDFISTKLSILTYKYLGVINYHENFYKDSSEGKLPIKNSNVILKEYLIIIKNFLDNIK